MRAGSPLQVSVVDAAGGPVAGAEVCQRPLLNIVQRADLDPDALLAARALVRFIDTDDRGFCVATDLGIRQLIDASTTAGRSTAWLGSGPAIVELRIGAAFLWSSEADVGTYRGTFDGCRVSVFAVTAGKREPVDVGMVHARGGVSPRSAALRPGDSYEFELSGGIVVPVTVRRGPPSPGERVTVRFAPTTGVALTVAVTDEPGAAIVGARVGAAWLAGADWQWSWGSTDAAGLARFAAMPLGAFWLSVEKDGYIEYRSELALQDVPDARQVVVLARGGTLRGRVTVGGEAVPDFSIVVRGARTALVARTFDFQDRPDGSFEVAGLTAEESTAFALAPSFPRTPSQRVLISADAPAELNFELSRGGTGRGRVLDASTLDPVDAATVQVWTMDNFELIRPFGPMARADSRGRFEVGGLAVGQPVALIVTAAGYAKSILTRSSSTATPVDLGVVTMSKPASLRVRIDVSPGDSPTNWQVGLEGSTSIAPKSCSESGEVRFDDVTSGSVSVRAQRGDEVIYQDVVVESVGETLVRLDLRHDISFEVECVAATNGVVPAEMGVLVESLPGSYGFGESRLYPMPSTGVVAVRSRRAPRVKLVAFTHDGRSLAVQVVDGADLSGKHIRLPLELRARSLQVVDARGRPTSGLTVRVGTPELGWFQAGVSDSDGRIAVEAPDGVDIVDVSVRNPDMSGGVFRDVDLRGTARVRFDPVGTLAVLLVDDGAELPGVSVWLRDGSELNAGFRVLTTGENGSARESGFLLQDYRADVRHPGLWPTTFELTASESESARVVEVRRRGSVTLHATRSGLSLPHTRLDVESVEFSKSVVEWVSSGEVQCSGAGLVTDGSGRVRLDGLPRGDYRWTCEFLDGSTVGGGFRVEPHRHVDVDVRLP